MHQKIGPFNLRMPARLISIYFSKMKKGKEKERRRRRLTQPPAKSGAGVAGACGGHPAVLA
jgi:hypothetical protein